MFSLKWDPFADPNEDPDLWLAQAERHSIPERYTNAIESHCTEEAPLDSKPRTAILGAGLMGCSIAAAFLRNRRSVLLYDTFPEALQKAPGRIAAELRLSDPERFSSETEIARSLSSYLRFADRMEQLGTVSKILETIPEKLKLKRKLYQQLEPYCAEKSLLFSNTSTIRISDLAEGLPQTQAPLTAPRFCGFHFFHPVRRRALVEIICGHDTTPETIAAALQLAREIDKTPIVVHDGPGFLVNRLLNPYLNESITLLEEGASMETINSACSRFGMEMGPFRIMDEIGLDVAMHSGWTLRKAFPERITSEELLIELIDAGRLGRKSGKGFYQYSSQETAWESEPQPDPDFQILLDRVRSRRSFRAHRDSGSWTEEKIAARIFLAVLLEAGRIVEEGVVDFLSLTDWALVQGLGFPRRKGGICCWARSFGPELEKTVHDLMSLGPRFHIPKIFCDTKGKWTWKNLQ